jgi:signal transduction histidine kinase
MLVVGKPLYSCFTYSALTIDVRDEGTGIPADLRERVFEPFYTTKVHGGGLGLAIVRRTVDLHGGSIDVACPPEGGTVITLRLPRRSVGATITAPAGAREQIAH